MGSGSQALFLLFQAVFPGGRSNWLPVLQSLREASIPLINWRQRCNLGDAVLMISNEDEQFVREITDGITDLKLKTRIEKNLSAGKLLAPRPFFWTTDA